MTGDLLIESENRLLQNTEKYEGSVNIEQNLAYKLTFGDVKWNNWLRF